MIFDSPVQTDLNPIPVTAETIGDRETVTRINEWLARRREAERRERLRRAIQDGPEPPEAA